MMVAHSCACQSLQVLWGLGDETAYLHYNPGLRVVLLLVC